jgi:hypothetical protein
MATHIHLASCSWSIPKIFKSFSASYPGLESQAVVPGHADTTIAGVVPLLPTKMHTNLE